MTPVRSDDRPTVTSVEEVTFMTTATVSLSSRPRAHGFDRALMRLSLALMVWARRRAGTGLTASAHARLREQAEATTRREHAWDLRAARVR